MDLGALAEDNITKGVIAMFRGRTLAGALVLCALAISALGAVNASAAGLTAVECQGVTAGTGLYTTSRCETPKVATSNFETVPFTEAKEVSAETPAGYPVILHITFSGLKVTITCTGSSVSGKVTNVTPGAEMQAHGTEGLLKITGCTAHLKIAPTEVCEIESVSGTAGQKGIVETNKLTATTQADHIVKVNAEAGKELAKFKILKPAGCTIPATTVTVTGTATATGNTGTHSHLTFSEPTGDGGEGTLELEANSAVAAYTTTYKGYTTAEKGKDPADRIPVGLETF